MTADTESVPDQNPPPFDSMQTIELQSQQDSKILGISLYSQRAEVTRLFKFVAKTGQNQVIVKGLPQVDRDSFRIEGRGYATIHDVALTRMDGVEPIAAKSPKLDELEAELSRTRNSLDRTKKAMTSLDTYVGSLNPQFTNSASLQEVMDDYEAAAEKLDHKMHALRGKISTLEKELFVERHSVQSSRLSYTPLDYQATVSIFADTEGEVEIALIYAVLDASWTPLYDIRVDTTKDVPVSLIYKAHITQCTGEDWKDVSINLETASPTFGLAMQSLKPWKLSIHQPPPPPPPPRARDYSPRRHESYGRSRGYSHRSPSTDLDRRRSPRRCRRGASPEFYASARRDRRDRSRDRSLMRHRELDVSRNGNTSTTYSVPGLMSIPSDDKQHTVTIVGLTLEAEMEWVCVPKLDPRFYLKANIKNASQYPLLPGPASIYVDGSFIARSQVPAVSPDEQFACPLGLDPSIRATYAPVVKKVSEAGFMTRSRVYTYTQRISIHNTKAIQVNNIKVLDQVPVSEDSSIVVKLVSPPLVTPDKNADSAGTIKLVAGTNLGTGGMVENKLGVKVPGPVAVASGVTAQWDGVDDIASEVDLSDLGSQGKLGWTCSIPAQAKVNLTLQWEVLTPLKTDVVGL